MPTITHHGNSLWYDVHGSGEPPVPSAGFGPLHNQWDFVRDTLAEHYQVIDWNYRGAGRSDRA
ncbi:MAG: alpha/beta fold hydrolase [Gammaproteobacteria bacterium]|jgi:pimeloyl-ACP methyl ester carboxylesterase